MTPQFSLTTLRVALSGLGLSSIGGAFLLAMPAIANPTAPVSPNPDDAFVFDHIEDYSPLECTGQVSYTTNAADIEARLASLTLDFDDALESILSSVDVTDCSAVTGTLSDTTQNINYLHETKGVYKVVTSAEPAIANTEDYLYTFDILGIRYIPYAENGDSTTLDMANSTMLRAVGGTCITDDIDYPYEADCTFAATNDANTELSVGKLYYYF